MNKKGFTLIELLIVVAIIGIIAVIAIPNLLVALQKGKQKATMGNMKSVGTAIESYITDWSFAPQSAEGSIATMKLVPGFSFYIKVLPTTDSWGTDFQYARGGINTSLQDVYSITSYGRDKLPASTATDMYIVAAITDFDNNIIFSNGQFTLGPKVNR